MLFLRLRDRGAQYYNRSKALPTGRQSGNRGLWWKGLDSFGLCYEDFKRTVRVRTGVVSTVNR